jgi:hypothetical protein
MHKKPRYKRGFPGALIYSPVGLLVLPALYLFGRLFKPSHTTASCVVTGLFVGIAFYVHGVNEGLLSSEHPAAKEEKTGLLGTPD